MGQPLLNEEKFSEILRNTVTAKRLESLKHSDQLTLGEIILKCQAIQQKNRGEERAEEPIVLFDFEYLHPGAVESWRGAYDELAINFTAEGNAPKLSQLLEVLEGSVGQTFEGYKGGDYTMSRHTPVWVANHGNAGNTAIIDVLDFGYQVVLATGYREY